MKELFTTEMDVRDYECDLQGIVNNANYLHYFEHTRHLYLRAHDLSFADLHSRGIDAVVARMTVAYKVPLRSMDSFVSELWTEKQGIKYVFHQSIRHKATGKLACQTTVEVVCLIDGVLGDCPELNAKLGLE